MPAQYAVKEWKVINQRETKKIERSYRILSSAPSDHDVNFVKHMITTRGSASNILHMRQKIQRCRISKLCFRCASDRHKAGECHGQQNKLTFLCKKCASTEHITSLCNRRNKKRTCLYTCKPLMPMKTMLWICRQCKLPCNGITKSCLLHTGSQRLYQSKEKLKTLKCSAWRMSPIDDNWKKSTSF